MRTALLHHRFFLVMFVVAVLLAGVWPVAAQTPPTVQTDCSFVLKSGIPFAWLRVSPSSSAAYTLTMQPGYTVQSNTPATLTWDGVQWWIYVWPNFAANVHGYYRVELNSLVSHCPQPNPPPPPSGAANWQQGNVVRVKSSVYFVWFRAQAAPGSTPIHTVFSGANLVVMSGPSQDSYGQWWWHMSDPRTNVYGWVEQNSVELTSSIPTPTPVPTAWKAGDLVRVRTLVPFSWLRSTPGSASAVVYTVPPGQTLILQDGPLSDNVQNWWRVAIPYSGISGWVEEGSLEMVSRA